MGETGGIGIRLRSDNQGFAWELRGAYFPDLTEDLESLLDGDDPLLFDVEIEAIPIDIGVVDGSLAGGASCLNRVHAYRDAAKDDIPALFRQDRGIANICVLLRLRHRKDHRQNFAHANSPEIMAADELGVWELAQLLCCPLLSGIEFEDDHLVELSSAAVEE